MSRDLAREEGAGCWQLATEASFVFERESVVLRLHFAAKTAPASKNSA